MHIFHICAQFCLVEGRIVRGPRQYGAITYHVVDYCSQSGCNLALVAKALCRPVTSTIQATEWHSRERRGQLIILTSARGWVNTGVHSQGATVEWPYRTTLYMYKVHSTVIDGKTYHIRRDISSHRPLGSPFYVTDHVSVSCLSCLLTTVIMGVITAVYSPHTHTQVMVYIKLLWLQPGWKSLGCHGHNVSDVTEDAVNILNKGYKVNRTTGCNGSINLCCNLLL